MIEKPKRIFARDEEWDALVEFAESSADEMRLGLISGRRRQGKTFLLQDLAEATGGFLFVAVEATERDALRQYGAALAGFLGVGGQLQFADWDEAIRFTLDRCPDRVVIIDEFPYLVKASPSLPSILQREIDTRGEGRSRARLLLCGSAMSVMGGLLGGQAPLRGRASLELIVQPFDYRTAARFWGLTDPRLACLVHAIVGGTPAYRRRFVDDQAPAGMADFDAWVVRRVLGRAAPLLREARYLLSNESDIRDEALYHSVLGAIAMGNNRRGGIATYMERKSTDIAHPLAVLEDCQLIRKEDDALSKGKPLYRIAEPLITFYQAVIRPAWTQLELGHAEDAWRDRRASFHAQVVGPHFETLCREFTLRADQRTFGGLVGEVSAGTVARSIQLDIVALAPAAPNEKRRLLSLGECKWGEVMNLGHLDRLSDARDLIHMKGYDTRDTVLACYSGAGFEESLRAEARKDPRVLLVDLDMLYG